MREKKKNDFALFFIFFLLKYAKARNASRFLASAQRDRPRGVWLDLGPRLLLRARHQQRGATGVGGRGLPPLAADRPQKPQGNADGKSRRARQCAVTVRNLTVDSNHPPVVSCMERIWLDATIKSKTFPPKNPRYFHRNVTAQTDSTIKAAPTAVCRYLIKISLTSSCSMKWIFISVEGVNPFFKRCSVNKYGYC